MKEVKLYFLGWKKHGRVQFLAAGPFIDREAAETERDKHKYSAEHYVICSVTLPFEVEDET